MQIKLSGHHIEITDSLRDYVNDKMSRLQRHFDNLIDTEVILSVEKLQQKAEANIQLGSGGGRVFANAVSNDMYAAIDALIDKLDRQIKKQKDKAVDKKRQGTSLKSSQHEDSLGT
ncbi:ribosome-associated translation inhibitor RaiA [Halorhodospira halochloris]|uniref:Ribosome hibernation promoting factor n=1 Tax=Halorhodospira halochloris TaxID=1052 RepID=A0A0X8XBQ1_HALHR|nr:ribosome-associated translation inhibitor RaiA [Halorhodospira halochloris]MBK1651684.1 ribosomal subunit interface protein [Halorhodospira halochloris]MCG5529606.1 ribosome-associated translation inhibitor RaiA [Halorhodospira halochloris]MCG5548115.1 ribosome-associated translation inhibitor RaiA [Halorhodospira halochloris]BAU58548.1 ribosome hibernation protein YhbH [Halorhodospira halochloris]